MARSEHSAPPGARTVVDTPSRLLRASVLVGSLFLIGTVGYHFVERAAWWDAFYMTVITITTVGFAEQFPLSQVGQALTVVLLVAGLGILGDATFEATLRSARVQHARGLVTCLNDDAHNVYTVLTARALTPAPQFAPSPCLARRAATAIRWAGRRGPGPVWAVRHHCRALRSRLRHGSRAGPR